MKKVFLGAAAVLAMAVSLAACDGVSHDKETYKPSPGLTPDCSKYTVVANELKCLRDQSRH